MAGSLSAAALAFASLSGAAPAGLHIETTLPRSVINGDEYTATPNGWILSHCVWEAESMEESVPLPPCAALVNKANPVLVSRRPKGPTPNPLPPDYDGWLQYAAVNSSAGYDAMTNKMSVPDTPKSRPQILYLFPGLQNIDWIPKISPEPMQSHFDIIQPVLQYPFLSAAASAAPANADAGAGEWGLRSWYVTVDSGAKMSTEIVAPAGDSVLCNMTKTGSDSWIVDSVLASSGKHTTQAVTETRLAVQPWAYVTVECYGCSGEIFFYLPLHATRIVLTI